MAPLVSVIIPAYNTEEYIGRAITSALEQTLQQVEVIVVDDASTDGTTRVVRQFKDDRLTLLLNSLNLGAAASRNRALEVAKGEWIALLDSDDWYAPDRLGELLAAARDHQADMIADDLYFVMEGEDTPTSTLIRRSGHRLDGITVIDVVKFVLYDVPGKRGLNLGLSKPLMRREFLRQHNITYDPALRLGQDFWLYLDCLICGAKYVLLPRPYYYYRFRAGSLVLQSMLRRCDGYSYAAHKVLQRDAVKTNLALKAALERNLEEMERLRAYYRVIEPLKQKRILSSFAAMVGNPSFFTHLTSQLPKILSRRWQYYFKGDRRALESRHLDQ